MKALITLLHLLKADVKNWIAGIACAGREQKLRGLMFLTLIVAFFVSAEYLSFRMFRAFLDVGEVTFEFIAILLTLKLLGLLFLVVMGLLFFGGLISAIETLYFDDDIDFLASHPIGKSAILVKKLISVYFTSAWVVFLIVTPVLCAYGRALGFGFRHLPLSLAALFFFTIPSVALSATSVIGLMRFMPIDRAKEAVLAFGAVLSFAIVYLYRLVSPSTLFKPEKLISDATAFVREATVPVSPWLPSNIMAKALIAAAPMKMGAFFNACLPLIGIAVCSLAIYLAIGIALFETDRPVSGSAARPGPLERYFGLGGAARFLSRLAPRGMRGLVYKEMITNVRDPMQISHLVLMFSIVILHFANLSEIPEIGFLPSARILVAFLNLGLVGFLIAAIAVRFIYPSISLEGRPFWMIETAPISPARFIALKFFSGWIPLTAASLAVVVFSNAMIGVDPGLMILWTIAAVAMSTVVTAFGISVGVTMPVFNKKNVFEISSSPGGIIFMLMSLLTIGGIIAVLVVPTYDAAFGTKLFAASGTLWGRPGTAVLIIVSATAALTTASYKIARRSIESFAEIKYGAF